MTGTNENSSKPQHIDAYSAHATYNSTAANAMLLNHHDHDDDDELKLDLEDSLTSELRSKIKISDTIRERERQAQLLKKKL